MSTLQASPNPIVIDNLGTPPQTTGTTQIEWRKGPFEELWEIRPGSSWTQVEDGRANPYTVTLRAGQLYRAGIYHLDNGPTDPDPIRLADLVVDAVLKGPGERDLITSQDENTGGTWHMRTYTTSVPTRIVPVGPSLDPIAFDADGIPRPHDAGGIVVSITDASGALVDPTVRRTEHWVRVQPLAPGNTYQLACMVIDADGNWQVDDHPFETLKRKLVVQFPSVRISNDGDPFASSAATFVFRVSAGDEGRPRHPLQDFTQGETDIDDGKTYPMGYAYVETEPQVIPPDRTAVWVQSWAEDIDGILEANEPAGNFGLRLPLPTGPGETVINGTTTMDCPPTADGSDFHYTVNVTFTAEYLP